MKDIKIIINYNKNPFNLFKKWFHEAKLKETNDPNAMNLSTIKKNSYPSSRMVLLKSYDKNGFVFFTNINSQKGKNILKNSKVALNFHWKSLLRQVRIEGKAKLVSKKEADIYFDSRPKNSKIGAWASKQSGNLKSRKLLERNFLYYKKKFQQKKIPRPPYWVGYRVVPVLIEFWQDMPFRLHDRLEYTKKKGKWYSKKLFP